MTMTTNLTFTTPFLELNDLLRETVFLSSDLADTDDVMLWHESLERVLTLLSQRDGLLEALKESLSTIEDYLDYSHNGDPWVEDARTMGEMDINDYEHDGRLEKARAAIANATVEKSSDPID